MPTGERQVVVTGLAVAGAFGRGRDALLARAFDGAPAFSPVTRFDTSACRTGVAGTLPGDPALADELVDAIEYACADARLGRDRAAGPLLLAAHADEELAALGEAVALRTGFPRPARTYTAACVAASTAIADAATMITAGRADRVVVAAGYLVDAPVFATFDAGRALARDGRIRAFSAGRQGMVLGDGVAAAVLESAASARERDVSALAVLAGWGRAGDAHHVCQPRPDGAGLARAVGSALRRGGVAPHQVGYVNANGTGTALSDTAEAAALHRVFGPDTPAVPVSSTKTVHGHALEASGLIEFACTVLALRTGRLPVNGGFVEPDPACALDLVLDAPRATTASYALSVNAAFGGANTALLVGTP